MEEDGNSMRQIHQHRYKTSTKQNSRNNCEKTSCSTAEEDKINQRFTNLSMSGHYSTQSLDPPASSNLRTKKEETDKSNAKVSFKGFETGIVLFRGLYVVV